MIQRGRERERYTHLNILPSVRHGLTQYAGLAQAGDRLSVVPAGEYRRRARAGDALRVRCWIFDRVQVCRPDLVIGRGVISTTPEKQHTYWISTKCV